MTQPQRPLDREPSDPPTVAISTGSPSAGTPGADTPADGGRIADRPSLDRRRKGKDPGLFAVMWFLLPLAVLVGLAFLGAP